MHTTDRGTIGTVIQYANLDLKIVTLNDSMCVIVSGLLYVYTFLYFQERFIPLQKTHMYIEYQLHYFCVCRNYTYLLLIILKNVLPGKYITVVIIHTYGDHNCNKGVSSFQRKLHYMLHEIKCQKKIRLLVQTVLENKFFRT